MEGGAAPVKVAIARWAADAQGSGEAPEATSERGHRGPDPAGVREALGPRIPQYSPTRESSRCIRAP